MRSEDIPPVHTIDLLTGKYIYKGQSLAAKIILKRTLLNLAFKCTITLCYETFPVFICKRSFSRLSAPLKGKFKLSFEAVKIPSDTKPFNRAYESTHYLLKKFPSGKICSLKILSVSALRQLISNIKMIIDQKHAGNQINLWLP